MRRVAGHLEVAPRGRDPEIAPPREHSAKALFSPVRVGTNSNAVATRVSHQDSVSTETRAGYQTRCRRYENRPDTLRRRDDQLYRQEGAVGSVSVPTVIVEDMQLLLGPASPSFGRELEHSAVVIRSALASGSVEIARAQFDRAAATRSYIQLLDICKNADPDFIPAQEAKRELAALTAQAKN
jgi:hypothetical protein